MRSWVWLRPPHPPVRVEVRPKKIRRVGDVEGSCIIKVRGASFCQVERIRPVVRLRPCRTSGSQKWTGARPSLRAKAIVIIVAGKGWQSCVIFHSPEIQALVVLANRIIAAAVACMRKYLVAASTARGWWCCAISGMMAKVLISRPIHARSQCVLVNVIVVPSPRLIRRVGKMYGFIGKGGGFTNTGRA